MSSHFRDLIGLGEITYQGLNWVNIMQGKNEVMEFLSGKVFFYFFRTNHVYVSRVLSLFALGNWAHDVFWQRNCHSFDGSSQIFLDRLPLPGQYSR